jgi:hypothetical protein
MAQAEAKTFLVEGATLIFRNFSGKEGPFNRDGDRNFAVILPPDDAEKMAKDGWNVRYLEAREEGDEDTPYITCAVSFKNYPPRVVMLTSRARTNLNEDNIEVLDWANIETADVICRGYEWSVGDKSGTKAYVKSLFVTIEEDYLERKYAVNEVEE